MSSKMIGLLLIVHCVLRGKGLAFLDSLSNNVNDDSSIKTLSFSWSDCGSGKESIQIQKLSLLPDPLVIPGRVYLGTKFIVNSTQTSPLSLSINVKKKVVFVWITIPCEHNLGSCDYPDVCQLIARFKCPQAFRQYGIPCQCPIPRGIYSLPTSLVVEIDKSILPEWLESGQYRASGHLSDQSSNEVLCIDLSLTVATKATKSSKPSIDYIHNNSIGIESSNKRNN